MEQPEAGVPARKNPQVSPEIPVATMAPAVLSAFPASRVRVRRQDWATPSPG